MVFGVVEVSPIGSKPPAAVVVRISKGGRHDLGAAAPLSISVFSLEQGSARGPVQSSSKLVEDIGLIDRTAIPMHRFNCCSGALCALASLGVCLPICLHD